MFEQAAFYLCSFKMPGVEVFNPQAEAGNPSNPSQQEALEFAAIVNFMRSDGDRVVFRRFEKLNLYNLLVLQHEIIALDQQVSDLESIWDGPTLARLLPGLRPLLKAYSRDTDSRFV